MKMRPNGEPKIRSEKSSFSGCSFGRKLGQNASKIHAGKEAKSEAKTARGGILFVMFFNEFLMNAESLRPSIHSKKTE